MRDIFDFWAECPPDARMHPADAKVLERVPHQFELGCLPIAFTGPLRTAPVVLLFLSPGLAADDVEEAKKEQRQAWYAYQRTGWAPFPTREDYPPAWDWWAKIVRQFNIKPEDARGKIAILNIGAYHSKSFNDWHMLTALPSSRVTMDWAQSVLFPEAEAGRRVVVCLRSAKLWGLNKGGYNGEYGSALYAPKHTRGGIMHKGPIADEIAAVVKKACGLWTEDDYDPRERFGWSGMSQVRPLKANGTPMSAEDVAAIEAYRSGNEGQS